MVAPVILIPPFFHWYNGDVPPFEGVAVNVTEVPAQTGFAEAAIETFTGSIGFTVMVTVFDVAGFPEGQVAFDVSWQVIASPATGT